MESKIFAFLSTYAHEPIKLYSYIMFFMLLSGFGVPIPEEVTLIASGLIAYMAMHPDLFPPPEGVYNPVNLTTIMIWLSFCVIFADTIIYLLGYFHGKKILQWKIVKRFVSDEAMEKINEWFHKYSYFACGVFRFTPGIRFFGHIVCGMLRIPYWKFFLVDLIVVGTLTPLQLYFIATYGDVILSTIKRFKMFILALIILYFIYTLVKRFLPKKEPVNE